MRKSFVSYSLFLALSLSVSFAPAHAQEEPKETTEKEVPKKETAEERDARKKAVLEKEREQVTKLLPHGKDISEPKEVLPSPEKDAGIEGPVVEVPNFRRSTDRLIADMIKPYDKCQDDPTSEEINAEYEKAYDALVEKIEYLRSQLFGEARKYHSDAEIKEIEAQLKRLSDFRGAMPKPGQCYGYHGR